MPSYASYSVNPDGETILQGSYIVGATGSSCAFFVFFFFLSSPYSDPRDFSRGFTARDFMLGNVLFSGRPESWEKNLWYAHDKEAHPYFSYQWQLLNFNHLASSIFSVLHAHMKYTTQIDQAPNLHYQKI